MEFKYWKFYLHIMKNNNLTLVILLSTLSIFVFGISSTALVYGQQEGSMIEYVPKFLIVQHSNSGSLSTINETAYSLELNRISDNTILFAERPDRIVKSLTTDNFIGNWSKGADNFVMDPPNAVIVVNDNEGQQNIAIIELFNPVYDSDKKSLKYDVIPDNATSIDLPSMFGQNTLVIDACCNSGWCGSSCYY